MTAFVPQIYTFVFTWTELWIVQNPRNVFTGYKIDENAVRYSLCPPQKSGTSSTDTPGDCITGLYHIYTMPFTSYWAFGVNGLCTRTCSALLDKGLL